MYKRMWPNTIIGGDRLPEIQSIVRRISYVTWNAVGNGGVDEDVDEDGFAFLHGTARWMNAGSRIIEITPELVKAVLRTGIQGIEYVDGNDFFLPAVLFVMPKGTLRSAVRGDCSYLLASISMPTDRTDFSSVGCIRLRQPCIWLLSTASSSYEQQVPEIICDELDLRNRSELEASILKPVPGKLIVPQGLAPLNDADFRLVCLHLGFKLLVLLNLYWSRLETLKIIYDGSGMHFRQRCPPEFFWPDFNLNSHQVQTWNRGTLIFHPGVVGERGVDADWILPSPGSGIPEPEVLAGPVPAPEPEKRVEPMKGWRKWIGYLVGTD